MAGWRCPHVYTAAGSYDVTLNVRWKATMTITGAGVPLVGEIDPVFQPVPGTAEMNILEAHAVLTD